MKQVLITGATSSQSSNDAQKRSPRFSGLLHTAFSYSGSSATISSLSIVDAEGEIDKYNKVIVGLAPFTSLSANKIYNALYSAKLAQDSGKLKILLDAPNPHLVYQSFRSILNNNSIFLKSLYSGRTGFNIIYSNEKLRKSMFETIEFLLSGEYDVIIPSVPYFEATRDIYGIPSSDNYSSLISLNFDNLFASLDNSAGKQKSRYWLAEDAESKWTKDMAKTVSRPVESIKKSQYDTEGEYITRMHEAYGFLLNPYKNSTPWWSPNIMVALACQVPVFSDWRHTKSLGSEWSGLPHIIEELDVESRANLAKTQKESYLSKLNSFDKEASFLKKKIFK